MEKKSFWDKKIINYTIIQLVFLCVVVSFIGFIAENVCKAIGSGIIDDRHQILPFLFAHGFGIIVLYLVFDVPSSMRLFKHKIFKDDSKTSITIKHIAYYFIIFFFIFFGEIMVGMIYEKLCGVVAWNYTSVPLHVTKYTSIPTTFGYTTCVYLIMRYVFPFCNYLLEKMPRKTSRFIVGLLFVLVVCDFFVMLIRLGIDSSLPTYWQIKLR